MNERLLHSLGLLVKVEVVKPTPFLFLDTLLKTALTEKK